MPKTPYLESEGPAIRKVLSEARQSRLSPREQKHTLKLIEKRMRADPAFFAKLKRIAGVGLRGFKERKIDVVVKSIVAEEIFKGAPVEEQYKKFYRAYRDALKAGEIKPKKYVLVPLKAYGTVQAKQFHPALPLPPFEQSFLVMERHVLPQDQNEYPYPAYRKILPELEAHLKKVEEKTGIPAPQHEIDVLFLGNTNPKEPKKGKWVIALPHDYI